MKLPKILAAWICDARQLYQGGVLWRLPYAGSFAVECLKRGYRFGAIANAYAKIVQRSHPTVRAVETIGEARLPVFASPGEPSAAAVYVWQQLHREKTCRLKWHSVKKPGEFTRCGRPAAHLWKMRGTQSAVVVCQQCAEGMAGDWFDELMPLE